MWATRPRRRRLLRALLAAACCALAAAHRSPASFEHAAAPRRARALRGVNAVQRAQADAAAHASLSGAAAPQLNAMLAPLLAVLLRAAGVPALATSALAFSKLQSALVTVEAIALVDTAASLVESFSTDTRTLTVVPGSLFVDAAAGKVVIVSLTALFDVQNATLLGGATPRIGVDIPLAVAAGKNNIPGLFIGGGYTTYGRPSRVNPVRGLLCWRGRGSCDANAAAAEPDARTPQHAAAPRVARRKLPAADAAALSAAGVWPALAAALPPELRARLTNALAAMRTLPSAAFLAAHGVGSADADAAAAALGLDASVAAALKNFTLAAPQLPLPLLTTTAIPLFDIEATVRLLLQENQNGASVRIGPTLRLGGDGTVAEGFIVNPMFTTFLTQTVQQLAAAGASAARLAAAKLHGDRTAAQAEASSAAAALEDYFRVQLGPLPTSLTIAFEVVMRGQISVNGGDLAAVI